MSVRSHGPRLRSVRAALLCWGGGCGLPPDLGRSVYHLAPKAPGRVRPPTGRPSRFPRRPSPEPPSAPLSKRYRLGGRPLIRRLADARGHRDGDDIGFAGPGAEPPTPRPLWDRLGRRPPGGRPAEDRALIRLRQEATADRSTPFLDAPARWGASALRSPRRFVATCSPPSLGGCATPPAPGGRIFARPPLGASRGSTPPATFRRMWLAPRWGRRQRSPRPSAALRLPLVRDCAPSTPRACA